MSAPLCFIDTETTGVHPARQVWEVAMIRRDNGSEETQHFFVDVDLSNADPFGLNVGRFYERHPQGRALSGRPDDRESELALSGGRLAAKTVARMTHGAHLVGAVVNFDAETLDPMLRQYGYLPAWHYHLIDVEALAVGWLCRERKVWADRDEDDGGLGISLDLPWKSDVLSHACGVRPPSEDERHTALGDARWAMRWYDAITGGTDA